MDGGITTYLGIFSMASPWDNYNPPLLTEQLLSAHNKIMEKKMIDSYKEGKRGDLKFLKNKLRRAAHQQAMKTAHPHHPRKHVNDKVHKTLNLRLAVNPAVVDPQASTIQLWPPFSVDYAEAAALPIQERPTQSQPSTTVSSSTAQVASSHQQQQRPNLTEGQSSAAAWSTQAMAMFPPYYISPHISSNQKPTGSYFVSLPTIFGQQPLQVQAFHGLYHPMDHGLQAGNFRDTQSQIIQRPPSRTGYLATSVKAEPGSDLESNLESNASISASVKTIKILSAGYKRFIATASNRGLPRTSLPDPFWLTNVEMTPQLTFNYQAEPCNLTEILKRDYDFLKKVNQPNQVNEQLAQLYRELDDNSDCNFPFLPVHPVVP